MEYNVYEPSEELSKYIRCFWSLESAENETQHKKERVFPDGCIELIVHYHDLFKIHYPHSPAELQGRSFIHGQLKKFMELEATGRIGVFSARFHPAGLRPFVDFDIHTLTNKTVALTDIWKEDAVELEQNVINCKNDKERIEVTTQFLIRKLSSKKSDDNLMVNSVQLIIENSGMLSLDELCTNVGLGKRQFERKFISEVGLNPKTFSRIIRFNSALQLIEKKDFSGFTSVAHEGGFYDQAHFIKDFKELTGLNPKKYFSENMEMVKFFNLV
jgi:AraC-like DNA-binding protein